MKIRSSIFALALALPFLSVNGEAQRTPATPAAASAPTAIPSLVPYSGVAMSGDGKPLGGETGITFLIYKDEQGGEPLWVEGQTVTLDPTGHYKVQLGAANPNGLPPTLFANGEARWLEVQIAGETAQARVLLASVPYALKAADAATLGGLPASAFVLAGSKNSAEALPAGVVANAGSTVTTTGGVSGYLPRFSGASTVVDSEIFDTGTDVGIGTATPTATLDVNGTEIIAGGLNAEGGGNFGGSVNILATGNATASAGKASQPLAFVASAYNSSSKAAVAQIFRWTAEPTGNDTASPSSALELLFSSGSGTPTPTGLSINAAGKITFASGQTFPGAGVGTITGVTAGTGLSGGGTSGNVTLNVNTSTLPTLSANNSFTGSNTFVPSLYEDTDVNIDVKNANSGNISPGLRLGNASGEGMASKRTTGGNQYGVDIYTGYSPRLSINASGQVAIGTGATFDGSQLQVQSATSAGGEFSGGATTDSSGNGFGASGVVATGGSASSSAGANSGAFAAAGITATGGNASGSDYYTFAGDGGDFQGGTATNAGCCYEGGPGGDSPAPLPYTGSGIVSMGGFAGSGQPGYGAVLIGGSTNTGTPAPGLYVISGTDQNSNQAASATFNGDVNISGTLNADVKNFRIDHPADPANKYLVHASIESSEMVNIYSGNVTTDELGLATVQLPSWFEVENGDFRYQLTVVDGRFAQAVVSKKIENHQFTIHTNASNVEVSWQITGVRQDAYAKAHPLVVEQAKPTNERGSYLHPELYGQPREKQTDWGRRPATMRHMKAMQEGQKKQPVAAGSTP